MKNIRRIATLLLSFSIRAVCIALVAGISWVGVKLARHPEARLWLQPEFVKAWLRVGEGMRLATTYYLLPDAVTPEKLAERALAGVGSGLDNYSTYLPAAAYEDYNEKNDQADTGIGAELQTLGGWPVVVHIHPGSGAAEAGVRPGDRVLKIAGAETSNTSLPKASPRLHGAEGGSVELEFWRAGTGAFTRRVAFRKTRVPSVEDVHVLADGVTGYLRIVEFKRHTVPEISAALAELRKHGARRVVLDLRDNPGGGIDAAVDTVGLFCPKGSLVATLRGRNGNEKASYVTKNDPVEPRLPLVLLVNPVTASSAEIVSGALQDLKRAVVVGESTRGKHVAQTIYELSGGDGLKLTTARYTLPSGRSVEGDGVRPDVEQISDRRELRLVRLAGTFRDAGLATEFARLYGGPPPEDAQLAVALETLALRGVARGR
jgi:carboxyl-terminal processing protease